MILSKLGLLTDKISARQTAAKVLDKQTKKMFFDLNHIEGDTQSKLAIGLFSKSNELIAAMSFRKPLHKSENTIEIARFCTKINVHVNGAVSKLFKKAIQLPELSNIKSVITYVDTRHGGLGKAYEHAGFSLKKTGDIRFWWTDYTARYNRFKFKADKKNNLTEAQVAEKNNVVKIWGCKNILLEFTLN